jgi:predicted acetyltransferase
LEIRKITQDEWVQASMVCAVAFLQQMQPNYREKHEDPHVADNKKRAIWAAYNEAGKMESVVHIHEYAMRFDGHVTGMGGIGGVSTLPEARGGGYVRRINDVIMPYMRDEQGLLFSFLFPWSFAFYRKFGYELCYTPSRLNIPMEYFRDYKFPTNMTMYEPGDDITPFHEVYNAFTKDMNLAVARDEILMKFRVDSDPYLRRTYAYLHRDADGRPDAYIIYRADVNRESGNTMHIRELAWVTPEGLHAIFGYIGGLAAQFEECNWDAPFGFNPYPLFPESYKLTFTYPARGMNRILNAPKVLKLLKAPAQPGKAVIQVQDRFMPVNSGTYALEWENGAITSVKQGHQAADLETDIETLAQLATGYLTPAEVRLKRNAKINSNEAALQALFPRKDMILMDYF